MFFSRKGVTQKNFQHIWIIPELIRPIQRPTQASYFTSSCCLATSGAGAKVVCDDVGRESRHWAAPVFFLICHHFFPRILKDFNSVQRLED